MESSPSLLGLTRLDAALSHGPGSWEWLGSVGVFQLSGLQSEFLCRVFLGEALRLASVGNLPESVYPEGSVLCPSIIPAFRARETFCRDVVLLILFLPKIFFLRSYWTLTELVKSNIFIDLTFCSLKYKMIHWQFGERFLQAWSWGHGSLQHCRCTRSLLWSRGSQPLEHWNLVSVNFMKSKWCCEKHSWMCSSLL